MSVREEDRNKNCPSRGLVVAAAAIGVGVGAALYYFFSKRENPADEGATTSGWVREQPHALNDHDSSYTTISEHSTTDTSIHDTPSSHNTSFNIMQAISRRLWNDSDSDSSEFDESVSDEDQYDEDQYDAENSHYVEENADSLIGNLISESNIASDSDTNMEWDVTNSSLDVPRDERRSRSPIMMQFGELTVRLLNPQSSDWNRDRSWSLEECSICFEVMLKDQEVLALPCSHRFHQGCVMPWLQEQQTCPNCRKAS